MSRRTKLLLLTGVVGASVCAVLTLILVIGAIFLSGYTPRIIQVAQAFVASPTSLPTRTPRPTFTPTTLPTATLLPTVVVIPATPTVTPTRTPTATRNRPTATPRPAAVRTLAAATPQAKSPYAYRFFPGACALPELDPDGPCRAPSGVVCHHSGGKEIRVVIYGDHNDPNSLQAGVRVVISYLPDGPVIEPVEITDGEGLAHKTLADYHDPATKNVGTYYVWIISSQGNRISEMSPPIVLTSSQPEKSDFCSVAGLFFAGVK